LFEPPQPKGFAMLAIAARPESVEPFFVDLPSPPSPTSGQVVCETIEMGICGTDREILHSQTPAVPIGEPFLVLGHECLAKVTAVGPGVSALREGDLVVPMVRRPVFKPHPRLDMLPFSDIRERGIYFQHGFATQFWLDEPDYLCQVDPSIAHAAVLAEPISIAEKGINELLVMQRARFSPDTWSNPPARVLVTGLGPIAFAGLIAATARGWPTTVCGRDDANTFRAKLVTELGGRYVSSQVADKELKTKNERDGFDLILECTGSEEVTLQASQWLATGGAMAWLGSSRLPEPMLLNFGKLMRDAILKNLLFVACVNSAPRDFHDALAHIATVDRARPGVLSKLFTHRVGIQESLPHYLARVPQGIKTVVHLG
jgi:threonine dehydrogenase-like Zn-dependent dehydrogenase